MRPRHHTLNRSTLAVAALLASLASTPARAAGCTWNTTSGNWNALANWLGCATGNGNPGGVPGAADSATIGAAGVVTINTGQQIQTLNNAGQINITAFGLNLAGGGSTTNTGVINVGGASTANMAISGGHNLNNTGGVINIAAGSVVNQFGTAINGGSINTTGTGKVVVQGFSAANFLNSVALGGNMDMAHTQVSQRVTGGLALNGTINVGSGSYLSFQGSQTLAGTGSVVFDNNTSNRINVDGLGSVLTIGAGATLRGHSGIIGNQYWVASGGHSITNHGTVAADVAGGTIVLSGGAFTNNGIASAANGGTLRLNSNYIGNGGSQLLAGAGSRIEQAAVTISGVMNVSGDFRPVSFSIFNRLDGVTLNGDMNMAHAQVSQRVTGGLALNGTVNVGSGSYLSFQGSQTLAGTGSVVFDNNTSNRLNVDGLASVLTIGANSTVRGHSGTVGNQYWDTSGGQSIINHGTVSADVAGGTIVLSGGAFTNNGIASAANGGTLRLQSNYVGMAGSQLLAGAGSRIEQAAVTISGVMNVSGDFRPVGFSAANFLDGVTLNGNMNMAHTQVSQRVTNGLALNGSINLGSGSYLNFQGSQTLAGTGSVVFDSNASNRISVDGNASVLTIGTNSVVRGHSGTLGDQNWVGGGGQSIVNNGRISADVAGGLIVISGSPLTNNSMLEAQNGGTLRLNSNYVGNAGSTLNAGAGSRIEQNGVVLSGMVNVSGDFRPLGFSANNFLNAVTLNGNMNMAHTQVSQRVTNGLALNGSINLGSGSYLNFQGSQTLAGTGNVVFDSNTSNRLNVDGNGAMLTIGPGATISGHSGTIGNQFWVGGGGQGIANNGTINASAAGGNLILTVPLTGTGTLQVAGGGLTQSGAGASTQGRLVMGASGSFNTSNQNLTLTTDYTNAAAGSGDSFNRRAGIAGTGQILAGGNAAQAISGAVVTGGNTNNATLTVGNVRVGATSFDYTVGNSGSTGPTLRGAVQTSVNGANLNDARLSGTGVASSNYNAGAPAGTGETRTVTFTAATAGALAALNGQVLNLRSNFENIADQKLNILLAAGAAAFNAAVGNTTPTPVTLANQRVGGTLTQALTVNNTAAAGAFSEDLRATFGATTGAAGNNGGSINVLVAGGSNNTALRASVDTSTAGAKTGTVSINYQTTGTVANVSNGLGLAGAGSQVLNINGNVYQAASGLLITAPLNFGTLQVGQSVNQSLVVRNTATGAAGFVEDLHAAFGASGNSQLTGAGALNGIAAGNNSSGANGSMVVTVLGASAGVLNSSIAVNFTSAGAVGGASNGLALLAVGSQNFGVSGTITTAANVINQANAQVGNSTINLGALRVGDAAPSGTVSVTNLASAPPQAALSAAISAVTGPATASGNFNLLAPGATNNTSLMVGLNTGTAGNFTGGNAGTATINFVSDASNVGSCAPNCQLNLASQVVNVEGRVYTQAVGAASGNSINFGVVRVGDTVSAANISINNTAASTALNDTLRADVSGLAGPFSGNASISGIAAQGSGQLAVGLNTASAGVFNQAGSLAFTSQNADMADVSAGANAVLSVFAQVNRLANGDFDLSAGAGTLTQSGTSYVLDLGNIVLGNAVSSSLGFDNDVTGPADLLSGSFDLSAVNDFTLAGWNPLAFLVAGQASGVMTVNWLATSLGLFSDTVVFNGRGTNSSDPVGLAQARQLLIRANVVQAGGGGNVPEPGTLALLLAAAAAALVTRRRSPVRTGAQA